MSDWPIDWSLQAIGCLCGLLAIFIVALPVPIVVNRYQLGTSLQTVAWTNHIVVDFNFQQSACGYCSMHWTTSFSNTIKISNLCPPPF